MGCAKNAVDSEKLMGRLVAMGHRVVEDPSEADVGIINTCGFIQDAVKENVDAILDLERMKEEGTLSRIIVAGCLVNRYEAELRKELPSVDLFVRAEDWDSVAAFLPSPGGAGGGARPLVCGRFAPSFTPTWSRYLKVGEGCDTFCSYCAIPLIRGRLRSVPVEALVEEAVALCASGARELCLVGQDLTAYGRDLYGAPALERLLTELGRALPGGTWLRLLYLHPDRMTEGLADFLMGAEKVLPYLDIPIQHIDDAILSRMNRRTTGDHIRRIFRHIRRADPLFALRTTLMTGFPGETEAQFQRVLDFLGEAELDRVGAFVYSPEEGTPAASFADPVPREVAEERCARLMEFQSAISQERGALFIGWELDVLIEEIDEASGAAWGRSYRDAPEVDGVVCVSGAVAELSPGDLIRVKITGCEEHDLFGTAIQSEEGR
ncbi:MAG: 30S ribosomal protein S12 methylthiotransferase RimO [Synergistaceae bacterium]|nr:30S ribosomal protein S12 methylthiotransferase RimO [Synergistaceae bacterium]